ncbi:CD209 antigen-like protein C isoform X1 [Mus musculus]|uniref:CD209 antigen-like protein C isoform X1 n=2 Tax=Mus musculus TaxID=10090 RepID=UPI00001F60B1|nr:CD209 antigen-like protein C isoform X1 [Mus musculus]|eukprot:XP_017168078.1 PREDICTED: CD209 antigen-like protein C isoform X1 [Mus musculus]
MNDSAEGRVQQLGSLDEEHLIPSGTRYSFKGFRFQSPYVLKKTAGYLCHGLGPFVLQLFCLTLSTILLLAILVKVSNVAYSHGQEQAKKEKVYKEMTQLKSQINRLCRPCPWDWTVFQGNCYFFSKFQQNWNDSVNACRKLDAQLVVIKSDDEQSFLQQTSKEKGYAWMGLSDLKHEGRWHWVDGSHLLFSFMKYWNKGEPNNEWEEDCAEFRGDGWNDAPCTIKKYWICKKSAMSCTEK